MVGRQVCVVEAGVVSRLGDSGSSCWMVANRAGW